MTSISAAELLRIWEEGLDQSLIEKSLRLLASACSVNDYNEIGRLSLGERDIGLLILREQMFGVVLKNMAQCPNCNEIMEWESNASDLHLQFFNPELTIKTFHHVEDGYSIHFRLPDSQDMSKVIADSAYREDPIKILADCVVDIDHDGKKLPSKELPVKIWNALNDRMGKEDPQADIRMSVNCPCCMHPWEVRFDIVSYIWAEINNWAQRILYDVHLLARSFGWAEKDILSMSARRRQLYLQLLGV